MGGYAYVMKLEGFKRPSLSGSQFGVMVTVWNGQQFLITKVHERENSYVRFFFLLRACENCVEQTAFSIASNRGLVT